MAEKPIPGSVESTAKSAIEAVEGVVKGAAEVVGGAVESAAEVAAQTAHQSELTSIAIVVLAALTCGMVLERFRQPALVG